MGKAEAIHALRRRFGQRLTLLATKALASWCGRHLVRAWLPGATPTQPELRQPSFRVPHLGQANSSHANTNLGDVICSQYPAMVCAAHRQGHVGEGGWNHRKAACSPRQCVDATHRASYQSLPRLHESCLSITHTHRYTISTALPTCGWTMTRVRVALLPMLPPASAPRREAGHHGRPHKRRGDVPDRRDGTGFREPAGAARARGTHPDLWRRPRAVPRSAAIV